MSRLVEEIATILADVSLLGVCVCAWLLGFLGVVIAKRPRRD